MLREGPGVSDRPWTEDADEYLVHPLLRPGTVRSREFQVEIAQQALEANALVVIPTGLGKTVIAALVISERLRTHGGRVLFLAPSRPLADQHARTMGEMLEVGDVACLTGTEPKRRRAGRWASRRVFAATPQVALNDLRDSLLPDDFSVVVFDEAHRAVGDYSYVPFAKEMRRRCPDARYLGLTASPGHELGHVEEVCSNLFIEKAIIRSREDEDVAKYVQDTKVEWIEVSPSEVIEKISGYLTKYYHERLNKVRKYGFLRNRKNDQVRIQDLNEASGQVFARGAKGRSPHLFQASRQISLARMAQHSILCAERQGIVSLLKFMEPKMAPKRKKIDASFMKDKNVERAYKAAKRWKGPSHPKIEPMVEEVRKQLAEKPSSKVIVFAELRDTVEHLEEMLRAEGMNVERFTGQGSRQGRKGMTQKAQREAMRRFSAGAFQVLCATSIAEEGLDVPQVDLVIFFEPVASDIRLIQRKGRTGRDASGKVVILTTDKTIDEHYLWAGMKREGKMKRMVKRMSESDSLGLTRAASEEPDAERETPSTAGRRTPRQSSLGEFQQ
jgi:ERCC4-related helicase